MILRISIIFIIVKALLLMIGVSTPIASAYELSGYVAGEGNIFFNDPLFPGQKKNNFSFAIQPEYYNEWENGSSFIFVPFGRLDRADSRRSHFDVRELNYLWLAERWELRVGVGKVFWGTTEFVHLVDIINQTDLIENIDAEDKLGQPMIHLSIPGDWGTLDLFAMPYFRERTFPGTRGRLRTALAVETDNPRYESSKEEWHQDFAVRYSHTIGNWDFGIYHFKGTGREPTLLSALDSSGKDILIPFYEQINQTGLDLQLVEGEWLWKLEAIYRTGQGDSFFSGVGGFEYTLVGIAETGMDLGIIGELAYDDRGDAASTASENDVMFGLRISVNDAAGSELLAGIVQDMTSFSHSVSIEANRRFGNNWKATVEGWAFFNQPENDLFYSLRDDDFIRLELAYYF